MKRLLALLLAAALLMGMLPAAAMADTQYATVIGGWLRLRATAGYAQNNVITSYYTGTVVEILGKTGEWYQVKTPDGRTGFMLDDFLQMGASVPEASTNGYVTSHNGYGVRLRKGPGTGYRVIAKYDVGTPVTVLESGTYWCKLNVNGMIGYMMSQFVRQGSGSSSGSETILGYATVWSANGYGVRLRTGPGTGYEKIGVYSVGTQVAILEKGAEWDRIQVGSRVGYMKNEFLRYYNPNEVTSVSINTLNPEVGTVMSVQALTPSSASVSYEWMVGGTVKGTNATYTVGTDDVNKMIQLKVTGTGSYTGSAVSSATNKVIASNQISSVKLNTTAPVTGTVLQATVKPEGATVSYVWTVDDVVVTGVNGSSYTVQAADVGKVVQVTVTGTGNYVGTASAATAHVMTSANVSGVTITNASGAAPTVGDTLNAVVSPAQATVTYQWLREGGAISGATGASYVLTSADEGKKISVTVTGTGSYGGTKTSEETAAVAAAPTAPVIDAYTMPAARVGEMYATQLTAQGGGAVAWSLKAGSSLPAGLELSSTGAITGTPSVEGSVTFTVLAQNSAGTGEAAFTITVFAAAAPMLTVGAVTFADVQEGYAQPAAATITLTNTGDADAALTSLTAENADGTLSTAFVVNTNGSSVIKAGQADTTWNVQPAAGLAAGTYTAVFKAYYDNGAVAQTNLSFTVTASAPVVVAPAIETSTLTDAKVDEPYSFSLAATGTAPITWKITAGALPAGITLNDTTGAISGTPTAAGTFSITFTAENSAGTAEKAMTLLVHEADAAVYAVTVDDVKLTDYEEGQQVSITAAEKTGKVFKGWKSDDIDVAGITDTTLVFSMPAFPVAVATLYDDAPVVKAPEITTNDFSNAVQGNSYSRQLKANGDQPITWAVTAGTLPGDLVLNETTGVLEGTLTAAGTFTFTVTATNAGGSDSKEYELVVAEAQAQLYEATLDGTLLGSFEPGEVVTVSAAEEKTKSFIGWTATGVSLADPESAVVSFKMPENPVSFQAQYEEKQEPTTLSQPEFIFITGANEVSWNGVEGAEEYALYVELAAGGQTEEMYTIEWGYVLDGELQPGDTVYVKAVGDGVTTLDSEYTFKTFE